MGSRLPDIGTDEMLTEILSVMIIEIHGQKSDVRRHIGIAEPFIELNTIENGDLLSPKDMLQPKVSVTVSNSIGGDSLIECLFLRSKKVVRPLLYFLINFPGNRHFNIFFGLPEVFVGILFQADRPGKAFNAIVRLCQKIELNQLLRYALNHF